MRWQEPAILSLVSEAAVTKFAPGVGRRPKKRYRSVLLGGLILAALWFNLCKQLSGEWLVNEQYNYGWFVPFISLYLFWLRWEDRPAPCPPSKTFFPWIFIGVPALFLLLPIRLFEIGTPEWRPLRCSDFKKSYRQKEKKRGNANENPGEKRFGGWTRRGPVFPAEPKKIEGDKRNEQPIIVLFVNQPFAT